MKADILKGIIKTSAMKQEIGDIFHDSIILDSKFRLVSISQNILDETGYTREELLDASIAKLSKRGDLKEQLKSKLNAGYFAEELIEIVIKNGEVITYSISGFYLGLISETNGLIVLRLKNKDMTYVFDEAQECKATEMDRFVYESAHALRGPLATIKGLINMANTCQKSEEMSFLIEQLALFADKLDCKLHKLIYYAQSDSECDNSHKTLTLSEVMRFLNESIKDCRYSHPLNLRCVTKTQPVMFENGENILEVLRNLVSFFADQSKEVTNELLVAVRQSKKEIQIILDGKGFLFNDRLLAKMEMPRFGYSEVLSHPELIKFFAAKKIVGNVGGNIQLAQSQDGHLNMIITLPH